MLTRKELIQINKQFRAKDESHLFPIRGKFNVTERAIRHIRNWVKLGGILESPLEYELMLESEMSQIVNDERNW